MQATFSRAAEVCSVWLGGSRAGSAAKAARAPLLHGCHHSDKVSLDSPRGPPYSSRREMQGRLTCGIFKCNMQEWSQSQPPARASCHVSLGCRRPEAQPHGRLHPPKAPNARPQNHVCRDSMSSATAHRRKKSKNSLSRFPAFLTSPSVVRSVH